MSEEEFNKVIMYVEDELTPFRIQLEEIDDKIRAIYARMVAIDEERKKDAK